jgi:beta-glucosidase
VSFQISPENLAFYGASGEWKAEPGEFNLWVGPHSAKGLEESFELQ